MNLDSKYFDTIRISASKAAKKKANQQVAEAKRICDWEGCRKAAPHPAPAAPHIRAGEVEPSTKRFFCGEHITPYNQSFNFFEGMDAEDVDDYRRAASTGHRPTWNLGVRKGAGGGQNYAFEDPLGILRDKARSPNESSAPNISAGQRRALDSLHLTPKAKAADIRKAYKNLVKKYHPDTNGGNRDYEERFQKVVQAYQYLRASGFC